MVNEFHQYEKEYVRTKIIKVDNASNKGKILDRIIFILTFRVWSLIFLFNFLILYITNKFKKKPIIENINPSANNIPVCKKISATKSIPKALNKSDVFESFSIFNLTF